MRVEVVESVPASAHVIRNLYPLYLHDLSEFSGDVPNEHGVYEPERSVRTLAQQGDLAYQRVWWEKPGVLFPFLVLVEGAPGGFALVGTPPYASPDAEFRMQEFFVVRAYRGRGIAGRAATDLFERLRGRWELAVLPRNLGSQAFWRRVIGQYTRGRFTEEMSPTAATGAMHTWRFDNLRHPNIGPAIGGST